MGKRKHLHDNEAEAAGAQGDPARADKPSKRKHKKRQKDAATAAAELIQTEDDTGPHLHEPSGDVERHVDGHRKMMPSKEPEQPKEQQLQQQQQQVQGHGVAQEGPAKAAGKPAPVLPWMRVPIAIEASEGVLLEEVQGLDARLRAALEGEATLPCAVVIGMLRTRLLQGGKAERAPILL
jgi:hypothetical protein